MAVIASREPVSYTLEDLRSFAHATAGGGRRRRLLDHYPAAGQPSGRRLLRQCLARTIHAPAFLDAEVSSVVRGLAITGSP